MMRWRWMLASAGLRWIVRRFTDDRAEQAAREAATQLPGPIGGAVDRLPPDVVRAGGRAILAGRAARTAAQGSSRVTSTVASNGKVVGTGVTRGARLAARRAGKGRDLVGAARGGVSDLRSDWERATDLEWRRHRADLARGEGDETAATDAFLDVRTSPRDAWEPPARPEPIASGRRRHVPELPPTPVGRVQRTYQRPTKAWDRVRRPRPVSDD